MERLTKRLADEQSVMDCKTCELEEKHCTAFTCRQRLKVRLAAIENILGAEYDLDHLCELVQAEKDGRVKILPKAEKNTCGDCKHFNRTPGMRSGTCSVREWCADKYGHIDMRRGKFTPGQAHTACKKYIAREGAEAALKGENNA